MKFYAAEVSDYRSFSYLCLWIPTFLVPDGARHKLGFIHRDIKPDVRISVTPLDIPAKSLSDLEPPF
jgi:hypothetical protein